VAKITACDTDLDAMKIARENAAANGIADLIEFLDGPLPADSPTFDVVCANLTLGDILPILDLLLSKTRRTLILSGILAEQEQAITAALSDHAVANFQVHRAGEWISLVCQVV
jgi:ribosomal protein L11 methyltransferase